MIERTFQVGSGSTESAGGNDHRPSKSGLWRLERTIGGSAGQATGQKIGRKRVESVNVIETVCVSGV